MLSLRRLAAIHWPTSEIHSFSCQVTKPPTASQITYTASDLAIHFVGKVDKIRTNTASAPPATYRRPPVCFRSFYVSAGDYGGDSPTDIAGTVQALRFGSGADLACETCHRRTSTSHSRGLLCVTSERFFSSVTEASPGDRAPQPFNGPRCS